MEPHTIVVGLLMLGMSSALSAQEATRVASRIDTSARASPAGRNVQRPPAVADSAPAPPPTAPTVPTWLAELQPNAFVSFGYTYNLNRPASRVNGLRVFDSDANTFDVDVAELSLQRVVAKPGDAGFHVDLEVGGAIPQKTQAYGLSMGPGADVKQALVSYIAPIGSGLRLDFGKSVTPLGYEVIEGHDGYNDHYSRSLLFDYAIPFTHTGVKATYAFSPALSGMLMVTNGWDDVRDNNAGKSIGGQLALTPAPTLALYLNYIGGPEKPDTDGYVRHTFGVVGTWKASSALTLGLNGDYAIEQGASLAEPGRNAVWQGVAGYLRYAFTAAVTLALRAERFRDAGGTRLGTGLATTASELTITPSVRFTEHFLVRGDVRFDQANRALFATRPNAAAARQATLAMNAVFVY